MSSSSLREKDINQRSIFEELRESDSLPEKGEKSKNSPICGAPEVHRPSVRTKATSKGTIKSKRKPVVSITVNTPCMADLHKRSVPSTNIPAKLPYPSAEGGDDGGT